MSRESTAVTHRSTPAFVWGYNNRAGLGLGHVARVHQPTPTTLPEGTIDVQGGINFTVVLTSAGRVQAWGGNQYGQLGDGSTSTRWSPVTVKLPHGTKATAIAVGTDHALALTAGGDVVAWGRNHRGQLGDGTTVDRAEPTWVVRGRHVTAIAAGNGLGAAVTRSGDLLTWGRNSFGQLGHSQEVSAVSHPTPTAALLPEGEKVAAVDVGQRHSAVVTRSGKLHLFGIDGAGSPWAGAVPFKAAWGKPVAAYSGDDFTLVLTNRHKVVAVGGNGSGQLGSGDLRRGTAPVEVTFPHASGHVTHVWAGARSAVVLTSEHEVYTWGDASNGQGGLGSSPRAVRLQPTPRKVESLTGARLKGVSGGSHHVVALAEHGPAVALRVTPHRASVAPGHPVTYQVHGVDAFGADLGPASHATLHVSDGEAVGHTVRAHEPGLHHVTARSGRLAGTAILEITNGHHS